MRTGILALLLISWSAAASAQSALGGDENAPAVAVRPYFEMSRQNFSAENTFENVSGERLDVDYLNRWIHALGLEAAWEQVRGPG